MRCSTAAAHATAQRRRPRSCFTAAAAGLCALLTVALAACQQPPGMGPGGTGPGGTGPGGPDDAAPSFGSAAVQEQRFRVGEALPVVTLPAARGGDGALRYRLTPQLPGLRFDQRRRRLSGTPEALTYQVMTYQVTDADGDAARLQFVIGVDGRECAACPEMVVVPPGTYLWTTRLSLPDVEVTLARPFAVGVYEVTFAEWDACLAAGGCGRYKPHDGSLDSDPNQPGWGRGRRPVMRVNWYDARRFAGWLTSQTLHEYRLLSASEWQYAARAGTTTWWHTEHTENNEITTAHANFDRGNAGQTEEVGSYAPNAFGLYDVHGNVWEWVLDCAHLSGPPPDGSPKQTSPCDNRFAVGGSFADGAQSVRSDSRQAVSPQTRLPNLGFRVARTLDTAPSFGAEEVAEQRYRIDQQIEVLTLPEARGGDGILSYRLTPEVPGLSFDAATRKLSGTPERFGYHLMTYQVSDADHNTDPSDGAGLRFTIVAEGKECADCPEMVVVRPGSYRMGSAAQQGEDDERPQHAVTIARPFAVGVYEVSFTEWQACAAAAAGCSADAGTDSESWGTAGRPVINVNWDDANAYAAWLAGQTAAGYRLLSESEWEYAARAGTTTAYHTGSSIMAGEANFGAAGGQTEEVGGYPANAFGLHDAHGNVREWVADCWNGSYTGAPSDGSVWDRGDCTVRVVRGGAWNDAAEELRSANRSSAATGERNTSLGFRVARTLAP